MWGTCIDDNHNDSKQLFVKVPSKNSDSGSLTSSEGVKNQSNQLNEGSKKDTDLAEEILIQNFWEKQTLQANASPISTKFASAATSFGKNESANDQVYKKLRSETLIPSNCENCKIL